MYRPTVRYADVFKEYVNALYDTTSLDRNQIIRAALFTAAHTKEFQELLSKHRRKNVPLPSPDWNLEQHSFWLEQNPGESKKEKRVEDKRVEKVKPPSPTNQVKELNHLSRAMPSSSAIRESKRQEQPVPSMQNPIIIRNQGGIQFSL